MTYKRKYPNLTKSESRHKFTEEECSSGGVAARWLERIKGIKLNHGVIFGKRIKNVKTK
jgi:hypothetical protein